MSCIRRLCVLCAPLVEVATVAGDVGIDRVPTTSAAVGENGERGGGDCPAWGELGVTRTDFQDALLLISCRYMHQN